MSSVPSHRPNDTHSPTSTSPPRDTNFVSYSRAVKKNLFSLPTGSDSNVVTQVLHKRVWLRSSEEFTIFFDTANIKCSPGAFHRALRVQFPIGVGLGIHSRREGGKLYYEVALSNQQACDDACSKGVIIDGSNHTPFRGLPSDQEVLSVYLKKIPLVDQETLNRKLKESLSRFGKVSELILYHESNGNWFLGEGMAVLSNCHPSSFVAGSSNQEVLEDHISESEFEPLPHIIDFDGKNDGKRVYYATWKSMPLACRYCHKDGHSRVDCPEKKKTLRCFRCQQLGHIRMNCPLTYTGQPSVPQPTQKLVEPVGSLSQPTVDALTTETMAIAEDAIPEDNESQL